LPGSTIEIGLSNPSIQFTPSPLLMPVNHPERRKLAATAS
jgi:hypothetical protein